MRNGLLEKVQMNADKIEIRKQWGTDPCGAETSAMEISTLAYYRDVRNYRYRDYAPWLLQAVSFSDWQNKDILEIGPGLGSDHFRFAERGNRLTAIDLSWVRLQHTRNHLNLERLKTRPAYGRCLNIAF